jgi:hypothetical protein
LAKLWLSMYLTLDSHSNTSRRSSTVTYFSTIVQHLIMFPLMVGAQLTTALGA